jgi:SAM-dependent MidA family methyltransferase
MAEVQAQVHAGGVQDPGYVGADALGGAGDQGHRMCRGSVLRHFSHPWFNVRLHCSEPAAMQLPPSVEPFGAEPPAAGPDGALPPPDAAAKASSERLLARVREELQRCGGALPFDRYMELALYAPGLGYYVAGSHKLGAGGDFITAPEVSPLFGAALARQAAQVLGALRGGDILEIGPGSGRLASDLLAALQRLGSLPGRYLMLETSPELAQRQRALLQRELPALAGRVHWLTRLPQRVRGLVLANEVLDALPVHRFRIRDGGPRELAVAWDGAALVECEREPARELAAAVAALAARGIALGEGYTSEINLRAGPWVGLLAEALEAGAVLLIDYGYPRREYYRPERSMGTLVCHYRHRAHSDPYRLLGLQDITAFVDFSAVAEAGTAAGLALAGYTGQANFLLGCGLEELLAESDPADLARHLQLVQGVKQLVLPGAMGERFQVLGLSRGLDVPLVGFGLRDLRERL